MQTSDSAAPDYVLGYGPEEFDRLILQANFFRDATAHLLRDTGPRPGMRSARRGLRSR